MVNRTVVLVALFAWICVTTVAQGNSTHNIKNYGKRIYTYRGSSFSLRIIIFNVDLASFTDDQCTGQTYCGEFCCQSNDVNENRGRDSCCADERMCCYANETMAPSRCGSDLISCPNSLPPNEVYDGSNQLRRECCVYFRSGCCSANENRTLDLL